MQRNFLRGLLVCLIPLLIASWFAIFGDYKKGIDLAGGTILTYEVDAEKTAGRLAVEKGGNSASKLDSDDLKRLAESIKRRIDPADLRNVIVRPVGENRVEIILPFTETGKTKKGQEAITENYVAFVKDVVSKAGVLEFRILANDFDDRDAILEAGKVIGNLTKDDAEKLAKAGVAPPAPVRDGGFDVKAASDTTLGGVSYGWVELSKEERESLGLTNISPNVGLKAELASRRGQIYKNAGSHNDEGTRNYSYLMYSREFIKTKPDKDEEGKGVEYFILTRVSPLDAVKIGGEVTLNAYPEQGNNGKQVVAFTFNGAGANKFGAMTERNRKDSSVIRHLAIVLDNKIVSAPTLNSPIRDRGQIAGNFNKEYVDRLVYILRSGALNAELKPDPVSESTVGPTLGADTIHRGLIAVGASFVAVLLFMVVYYRFAGFIACVALLANLLLTVGFMVGVNAAFTLAGLAGLVLMLGMAVDANVLIYERIREERERGATLIAAIRNGYDRSLNTILDTHITSILTAIVLYAFGNDNLKGFSVSLTVGLLISLFTSLYMTRLIFDYCLHMRWLKSYNPLKMFTRPTFNPMKWRRQIFVTTIILTLMGLGLFLARGKNTLNVDFNGGATYTAKLAEPRALSGSSDKPGLLDLLADKRQKTILDVKPIQDGGVTRLSDQVYQINYTDGQSFKVTLAGNPAPGQGEQAELVAVRERASVLPDWSVEQINADIASGTSTLFTVRTTEKEKELVEALLSKLLKTDDKQPLLERTTVAIQAPEGPSPIADLEFSRPTARAAVERQLRREFTDANLIPAAGGLAFEVIGIPSAEGTPQYKEELASGKYTKLRIDVRNNTQTFPALIAATNQANTIAVVGGFAAVDPAAKLIGEDMAFRSALAGLKQHVEAQPLPESVETFDTTLADDTRNKALYAILASWLMILAYLWFRFGSWTFGLAAVLCLIHDLCFTLGCIAICHYLHDLPILGSVFKLQDFKIDLAAVAALLTLVGYSVNDTIVVFDRIREVRGKNPALTPQIINDSVNQTLSRTVLASLTVLLVVGVLYFFGGNGVHLFSFVMVVGVFVGTYSSIFVASPLLLFFGEGDQATTEQRKAAEAIAAVPHETVL